MTDKFKKWPSLINTYKKDDIIMWLNYHPELENEEYIITEKLHGSNFQWFLQSGQPMRCGSRNNYLNIEDSFQKTYIPDLVKAHENLLNVIQSKIDNVMVPTSLRLFGELIGTGIQRKIDYGLPKRLLYFGFMLNNELQSFSALVELVGVENVVPIVGKVKGLTNSLNNPILSKSIVAPTQICEGVVIQPYNSVFKSPQGSAFILKSKNTEFLEKVRIKHKIIVRSEVAELKKLFMGYVNDNRIDSVLSKYDSITSHKEIGKFIKLVLEDAKQEFNEAYKVELSSLNKVEIKNVYNVGSVIANKLRDLIKLNEDVKNEE